MNLKPGDLVLVKTDTWQGKRKIKDRWEEETWEVVDQIVPDVPSYEVTNHCRLLRVLHQNQLLLICVRDWYSLVYVGSFYTWDRCTSPTPHKTTSVRGGKKRMPQEESGKAVTQ